MFSILEKVTIGVLGEGFIDPGCPPLIQCIWNDFEKFRTGPRTTPTVSAMDPWSASWQYATYSGMPSRYSHVTALFNLLTADTGKSLQRISSIFGKHIYRGGYRYDTFTVLWEVIIHFCCIKFLFKFKEKFCLNSLICPFSWTITKRLVLPYTKVM